MSTARPRRLPSADCTVARSVLPELTPQWSGGRAAEEAVQRRKTLRIDGCGHSGQSKSSARFAQDNSMKHRHKTQLAVTIQLVAPAGGADAQDAVRVAREYGVPR